MLGKIYVGPPQSWWFKQRCQDLGLEEVGVKTDPKSGKAPATMVDGEGARWVECIRIIMNEGIVYMHHNN